MAGGACQCWLPWGRAPLSLSAPPAALTLRRCFTPTEQLPSPTCPLEELCGPETLGQDLPGHRKSTSNTGRSCLFWLPWRSALWSPSGPSSCSHTQEAMHSHRAAAQNCPPLEVLHSPETPEQALPCHRKSTIIVVWTFQSCTPSGSFPWLQSDFSSPAHPQKMSCFLKEDHPTLPALGKHSTEVPGQTMPYWV